VLNDQLPLASGEQLSGVHSRTLGFPQARVRSACKADCCPRRKPISRIMQLEEVSYFQVLATSTLPCGLSSCPIYLLVSNFYGRAYYQSLGWVDAS